MFMTKNQREIQRKLRILRHADEIMCNPHGVAHDRHVNVIIGIDIDTAHELHDLSGFGLIAGAMISGENR